LFEFRIFSRAIEVMNQNVAGASLYRMREAFADAGAGKANQILVWSDLMDSKTMLLTPNTEVVYAFSFLDLKNDGPTVVEAPPKMLGLVDDMWMRYVGDIGVLGPDKGRGGKFLFLPPGYEGEVPQGYYVMRPKTYGAMLALRAGLVDGKTDVAKKLLAQIKVYPLAKVDNPEPTIIINASGMEIDGIQAENYATFEELGKLVAEEHPDALPAAQRFYLAAIGMEFGKPFQPDSKTRAILVEAAEVGAAMLRTNMWEFQDQTKWLYPDRRWWTPFVGGKYNFDPKGYLDFDNRAFFSTYACGSTPAMAMKFIGAGSQYLAAHQDSSGATLDGSKTYKLNVPAGVPARNFWSVVVYDTTHRSMIQTSQLKPSVSNYSDPVVNVDGSIDIYFSPEKPSGKEVNWIETIPGKGWTMLFRLFGPEEAFYNKSWRPNDIELVD
ncbi:MAG: DUF1254 domain-containing protein, partial [Desulfuromonadales bacterium]|nr:DUF1254 domain-containing protein [Desulfuromonadales bacterium]